MITQHDRRSAPGAMASLQTGLQSAWLWQNKDFSDVTLRVYPAGEGPDGMWAGPKPDPIATLPLHACVLSCFSPGHFRRLLQRKWSDQQGKASPGAPGTPEGQHHNRLREQGPARSQLATANAAGTGQPAITVAAAGTAHGGKSLAVDAGSKRERSEDCAEEGEAIDAADCQPPKKRKKRKKRGKHDGTLEGQADWAPMQHSLEIVCFPGEPQTVPEAVLRHAYTGQLPEQAAASFLAWMVWRADYLDMKTTVDACMAGLMDLSEREMLALPDVVLLSKLPTLQTQDREEFENQVARMASVALASRLRCPHAILTYPALLEEFISLPYCLLHQWRQLVTVQEASECTLVALYSAWYDHHTALGHPPTEGQCMELSEHVQLIHLPPSFHYQVLPHLHWYRTSPELPQQHALLRTLALSRLTRAPLPQPVLRDQAASIKHGVSWETKLTPEDVDQLCTSGAVHLGAFYTQGYRFLVRLVVRKQKKLPSDAAVPETSFEAAAGDPSEGSDADSDLGDVPLLESSSDPEFESDGYDEENEDEEEEAQAVGSDSEDLSNDGEDDGSESLDLESVNSDDDTPGDEDSASDGGSDPERPRAANRRSQSPVPTWHFAPVPAGAAGGHGAGLVGLRKAFLVRPIPAAARRLDSTDTSNASVSSDSDGRGSYDDLNSDGGGDDGEGYSSDGDGGDSDGGRGVLGSYVVDNVGDVDDRLREAGVVDQPFQGLEPEPVFLGPAGAPVPSRAELEEQRAQQEEEVEGEQEQALHRQSPARPPQQGQLPRQQQQYAPSRTAAAAAAAAAAQRPPGPATLARSRSAQASRDAPAGPAAAEFEYQLDCYVYPQLPQVLVDHGVADKVPYPLVALSLSVDVSTPQHGPVTGGGSVYTSPDQPACAEDMLCHAVSCAEELGDMLGEDTWVSVSVQDVV